MFCPLYLDPLEVELGLLALKNVSVGAAALAGARGDGGEDAAGDPVGAVEQLAEALLAGQSCS